MDNSKSKNRKGELPDSQFEEASPIPTENQIEGGLLTVEEREERDRLEEVVRKSFYSAGKALAELRDKKLYRDLYPTFEEYCRERFGFHRRHPYQLINAAAVVDNLIQMCAIGAQNSDGETSLILPTSERQVRDLTSLAPAKQVEVWMEAVLEAGNKVPSARVVKSAAQRILEKNQAPNPYRVGEVCQILVKQNPDLRGRGSEWCIIKDVLNFSCNVRVWDGELQVPIQNLKDLGYSPEQRQKVDALCARLNKLSQFYKEKTIRALLEQFAKSTSPYLLPVEQDVLSFLETRLDVPTS